MTIDQITRIGSHPQALAQCDRNIKALGAKSQAMYDTAGAAKETANKLVSFSINSLVLD
jgi:prephenate dehydratase